MPLGLENIKGLDFLNNLSLESIFSGAGTFFVSLFVLIVVGGLVVAFVWKRKQTKLFNKQIFWFEEEHGSMKPAGYDWACELTIPNTSISVFYIKNKDIYLPRPTIKMGKNSYWYCIKNNREIVNFAMKNMNKEMTEANLDYDHTDMRYALVSLKDLIKRNYRDKSRPWWKEYKDVITVVVYLFVITMALYFLLTKIGDLIAEAGRLIEVGKQVVEASAVHTGSGIIPQ